MEGATGCERRCARVGGGHKRGVAGGKLMCGEACCSTVRWGSLFALTAPRHRCWASLARRMACSVRAGAGLHS
eukprot:scaffold5138_cov125-Isochrysis_galbana.AAC.5